MPRNPYQQQRIPKAAEATASAGSGLDQVDADFGLVTASASSTQDWDSVAAATTEERDVGEMD